MSGAWGCPHEVEGLCQRLNGAYCDPGMRGCVLDGKVTFADGLPHAPGWPAKESVRPTGSSPLPREAPRNEKG